MKEIQLTRGKVALVDDDDYERLTQFKWYCCKKSESNTGYAFRILICDDGTKTTTSIHREILNAHPGQIIDHINGDGFDNRKENLRFCTNAQNAMNSKKKKGSSSKFKGIHFNKQANKWQSQIHINGKSKHLGYFEIELEAHEAYVKAAIELFGEFFRAS